MDATRHGRLADAGIHHTHPRNGAHRQLYARLPDLYRVGARADLQRL